GIEVDLAIGIERLDRAEDGFPLTMPGTRPSEWMSDTFPAGIAADQPGGDVARLLELAQRLVVGGRNGQPPVRMQLVFDLAVAVGPFSAAANNNGRCSEQLFELGECLPRVLVAVDRQDHPLREVGLFGAVAVPENCDGWTEDDRMGCLRC